MVRISNSELHRTIWEIMKAGDLNTLTAKKIRVLCEKKYKTDLTDRKSEIDDIVMAFVKKYCDDAKSSKDEKAAKEEKSDDESAASSDSASGSESNSESGSECSDSESSDEESDEKASSPIQEQQKSSPAKKVPAKNNVSAAAKKKKIQPTKAAPAPKKVKNETSTKADSPAKNNASVAKKKKVQSAELDDEALARKLQAEEFSFRRATVERGFRNTSKKVKPKTEATKKNRKASPFMKKCVLSPALAEVIGETEMSRPDVVQKMWSIVRERNLFDESNKQFALCDEQLTKLFGKKRVRLIGMMKYLKNHIKDIQ